MYSAKVIASKFIEKGINDGNPVTQMKLQKLIYFAHGLFLADGDGPLVTERFEAWKYGPVLPSLYQHFKLYGSDLIEDETMLNLFNDYESLIKKNISAEASSMINAVWDLLKDVDAIELSAMTHEVGSPWANHYKPGVNEIIPNEELETYFKRFIKEN
jgi:uncharacterized phage-associated protein